MTKEKCPDCQNGMFMDAAGPGQCARCDGTGLVAAKVMRDETAIHDAQTLVAIELEECFGAGGPTRAIALAISQLIRAHMRKPL